MKPKQLPPTTNHSVAAIASRWGTSHSHVLGLIYSGALQAIDISTNPAGRSHYIIRDEVLQEFEAGRTVAAQQPAKRRRVRRASPPVVEFIR